MALGKSTLFNLICGTHPVDAGEVHFSGRNITRLSSAEIAPCRFGANLSANACLSRHDMLGQYAGFITAGGRLAVIAITTG